MFKALLFFLIICFPVILMLAWAYDLTPAGLQRTPAVDADEAETPGTTNTEAFNAYLKSTHFRNRGSDEPALRSAVEVSRRTLELDSHFPRPHYTAAMSL
jgi:hypothetical protein